MGSTYLLDTNVLLHAVRDDAIWHRLRPYSLLSRTPTSAICVVSIGELMSMAERSGWQTRRLSRMNYLFTHLTREDINVPAVYQAYARIDTHSHAAGKRMGKNDLWVAAVANAYGYRLLTTDADFDHLAGTHVDLEFVPQSP